MPVSPASSMIVLSNRLPVLRTGRGRSSGWMTSPGGLVSALTPILRKRSGTWIGWTGSPGPAPEPFDHEGIHNHPIHLTKPEVEGFYEGFSNRALWPLYHDCIRIPEYHRRWWHPYLEVNRRFAEAAARTAAPGAVIWVNDYHLQLVPSMLRGFRDDLRIGFFLHIPFPPQELFAQLPWRKQILKGLLAADVVGFQTRVGAQNFGRLARRYAGASGRTGALQYQGRTVMAREFPVSVDAVEFEDLASSIGVIRRAEQFRAQLRSRRLVLGVDRLDYTKGIDLRLTAYRELLRSGRIDPKDTVLVQVAVPSRERVDEYRQLRARVEQLVGEINGEFGDLGWTPVQYLHRSLSRPELVALYRAADVLAVTPFRDGMNLVAKEYVATRVDDTGALILSEFTGSARELKAALLVNPYDIDGVADAMQRALNLSSTEERRRMRALRRTVHGYTVYDWARSFLEALEP
jgi:trehalose 6-phosphate synthase